MPKTRSEALDEAVVGDVRWRTTKVRTALDHGNFVTALDYLKEAAQLVEAVIERHSSEFPAATPGEQGAMTCRES